MGRCMKHEAALEGVRSKAEQTEDELNQLQSWKTTMEKKFELSEREEGAQAEHGRGEDGPRGKGERDKKT